MHNRTTVATSKHSVLHKHHKQPNGPVTAPVTLHRKKTELKGLLEFFSFFSAKTDNLCNTESFASCKFAVGFLAGVSLLFHYGKKLFAINFSTGTLDCEKNAAVLLPHALTYAVD